MLNSRDINKLRPDVAANCRKLIELAADEGYKVLVTGTVRDDEYQLKVYNEGHSKSKTPTFHSVKAGLAFDICQNIKGREYNDNAFWACVSRIGKAMGFTWGGDWKSIVDKPHFQWDEHGKYTGSMILAGRLPPPMPLWEDEDMTPERFAELYDQINPMIKSIDDPKLPASLRPEVQKLLDSGAVNGGTPSGVNARDINLRLDTLKAIIVSKR